MRVVRALTDFAQFQGVMAAGKLAQSSHFALYVRAYHTQSASQAQFFAGTLLPKRCAKRAVTRNMVRRISREWFSAHSTFFLEALCVQQKDVQIECVLHLRQPFDRSFFVSARSSALRQEVWRQLRVLWQRAHLRLQDIPVQMVSDPEPVTCSSLPDCSAQLLTKPADMSLMHSPQMVNGFFTKLLYGGVKGYQLLVSPMLPPACRHEPTCSQYALQALREHGAIKGTYLCVKRVLRCNPWADGGYDPVPKARVR